MSHIFLSIPRSGSHYIQSYLQQVSGELFDKSHVPDACNGLNIIGIVRSPEDTLRSWISMTRFYDEHDSISIESMLFEYVRLNKFIIDEAKVIIDYDSFINNPKGGIDSLCSFIGLDNNGNDFIPRIHDLSSKGHLVTSKSYSGYNEIDLSTSDLTECNYIYSAASKLSII